MNKRVALIGAGPSGLSFLHAVKEAQRKGSAVPEVVCFEKQSDWGGLWNYSWRVGTNGHGLVEHGSMYRFLWSNGPKECLEFADYSFDEHFGQAIPSFPPRDVLFDYIKGRAIKSGFRDQIRFNTVVNQVTFDEASKQFSVKSNNYIEGEHATETFDYVVVATGHFSTPRIPEFEGFDYFPGRVLHAHDFRSAEEFTGKNVLIIGGSYSAEDIGLQCYKYGAKSVTSSYRTEAMGFDWPENYEERPLLLKMDGQTAHFKDGSCKENIDAIILCTGYLHSFPFMSRELCLDTPNILYPENLYKGVVWNPNPQVMYLSMQDQWYTFSMFDLEAWYARDVIMGKIALPDQAERTADIQKWRAKEDQLEDAYQMIEFQAEYMQDIAPHVDYPSFDVDATVEMFKVWKKDKQKSILAYRDEDHFKSPVTGTKSPRHHTPWIEALDDSMKAFLDN